MVQSAGGLEEIGPEQLGRTVHLGQGERQLPGICPGEPYLDLVAAGHRQGATQLVVAGGPGLAPPGGVDDEPYGGGGGAGGRGVAGVAVDVGVGPAVDVGVGVGARRGGRRTGEGRVGEGRTVGSGAGALGICGFPHLGTRSRRPGVPGPLRVPSRVERDTTTIGRPW
ncbi:hypothetical protein ACFT7S_07360 [Streptomyces sp. NPDC057136]|uniref:hypothetical protein n=1 Tax=Streptomyces sp. NPDC057136 TaxID=3346029 RepID=UPI0036418D11